MRGLLLCLCAFLLALPAYADKEGQTRAITKEFTILYRFDSKKIDPEFSSNAETIQLLKDHLQDNQSVDSVIIYVGSSPDGVYLYNARLSEKRAEAARQYLLNNSVGLSPEKIRTVTLAENWQGLLRLVEENYFRHDREKVITILNTEGITEETREWRLKRLDDGYTWSYLRRHFMPQLRSATWISVRLKPADPVPAISPICAQAVTLEAPAIRQTRPAAAQQAETPKTRPQTKPHQATQLPEAHQTQPEHSVQQPVLQPKAPLFAFRTNLLVPALNAGVELPLGNNWSVAADYYFPWFWPDQRNKDCFELLGWNLEGRYWFGKDRQPYDRLKGHSVGAYVAGGYYDFEKNYRGMQGEFVSSGIDYTYSMAIGRKKNLHLQFTLAVGYIRSWGRTYNVYGDYGELYPDEGTLVWDYVGPTKAAVTLVVPIYRKEGRR